MRNGGRCWLSVQREGVWGAWRKVKLLSFFDSARKQSEISKNRTKRTFGCILVAVRALPAAKATLSTRPNLPKAEVFQQLVQKGVFAAKRSLPVLLCWQFRGRPCVASLASLWKPKKNRNCHFQGFHCQITGSGAAERFVLLREHWYML